MTPEQAAQLDRVTAQVQRLSEAMFVDDAVIKGYPSVFNMLAQVRTSAVTFWDGFPGNISDSPGSLARAIKAIKTKVGA